MINLIFGISFLVGLCINMYFNHTKNEVGRGARFANKMIFVVNVVLFISVVGMLFNGATYQKEKSMYQRKLDDSIMFKKGYDKALEDTKKDSN